MRKIEFKEKLKDLINEEIEKLSWDEKLGYIRQILVKSDKENNSYKKSNKGKAWSNEELRLVLNTAPTKDNIMMLAKVFHRGCGSVEQIFKWAATPQIKINKTHADNKFIKQIKKVVKEIGLI